MSHASDRIQRQANDWYLRVQAPDCPAATHAACRRWRGEHPMHEAAFQQAATTWKQGVTLLDDPELSAVLRQTERQLAAPAQRIRWRWPVMVAAATAAAVLMWVAPGWRAPPEAPGVRHHAAVGEQRRIELEDGSALILDTDTAVVVRYGGHQRLIELETGQANFAVAHDASRPFKVRAAGGSVTALGTHFNVRVDAAASRAAVTLLEGRVVVEGPHSSSSQHAPATLRPGQQLRFDHAGQWTTAEVDLHAANAWTRGTVQARDWPLAELLAEMNRYTPTQVRLADPTLAELRVSGTFRTGDTEALTWVLEQGLPIRAQADGTNDILLSRRQ